MARSLFGGRVGDTVASLYNLGNRQVFTLPVDANGDPSSVTLQVWDAVGGTQLTDLLAADGTTPITVVTVPASGQVPEFYGPDGVNVAVYVKDPDDDFYRLDARADVAAQVAADAQAAAEAAQAAAEAVGNTNDTIMAGRINDPASATASALSASIGSLKAWAKNPDNLVVGSLTYSSGLLSTAAVVWPDGATGTLTITSRQASTNAVTAYTITRVTTSGTQTYTQPTITRDSSGNATTVPQITVA